MKTCPFCSQKIPDEALICPHCGRDLAAAAQEAAARLRTVGGSLLQTVIWLVGYVVLTTLVRSFILYFTAPTLGYWSVILAGVASLAIVGYGALRAQQQKRFAIRLWLLVYAALVVLWTVTTTIAFLRL